MNVRLYAGAALVMALWCQAAWGSPDELQITLEPPGLYDSALGSDQWKMYLNGIIDRDAVKRVASEFHRIPNENEGPVDVYLNSPGGDYLAGIELGRLLRSKAAWTHVGKRAKGGGQPIPGECYSACAMTFLGGFYRFGTTGSRYGVHRTWRDGSPNDSDFDVGQVVSAATSTYIREMGVDGALLDFIVQAGKSEVYLLSDDEQRRLRVVNEGRGPVRWDLQQGQGVLYLRGIQHTMYGEGRFILLCENHRLTFYSIYEAGPVFSVEVESGHFAHSLLIDGAEGPLPSPSRLDDKNGYLHAIFHLSEQQIESILAARESLGHAMQMTREAPIFLGYKVDLDTAAVSKIREYVGACRTVSQ